MIILSLDSGIEKTGYCLFDKSKTKTDPRLIQSGLILTSKLIKTEERLKQIYYEIRKLTKKYRPDVIVIEELFFFKNQKTIVRVSQSQGVILLIASLENVKIETLTPLEVKQSITGYGVADKKSVQKMLKLLLKIDFSKMQDDETDAIAVGLAYCYRLRNQLQ